MALYEYSWLILLSPLFAFAVIIFGTRMWDLATRGRVATQAAHEAEAHAGHNGHDESDSDVELMHEKGPRGEDLVFEDIEDPKVPQLTMGAKISGYLSVVIMALACIYAWILMLNTAGLISVAPPLPTQGISLTQISYAWCQNIDATNNCFGLGSYVIAFHLDNLAIVVGRSHQHYVVGPILFARLHGKISGICTLLCVSFSLCFFHANDRLCRKFPGDLHRMGTGRSQFVLAHRVLVQQEI